MTRDAEKSKWEERILRCVQEKSIVGLLRDLVLSNTVNPPGNERPCCELVADYLRDAGAQVEIVEYEKERANVVARIKGSGGSPSLMFNGHLDVVSVGEGWTKDPFGAALSGGRMYGRGTSDMKSGVASAAAAMKAILQSGISVAGDLVFTAVADEESFGPAGTKYLLKKGVRADAAIVTEPTNLQVEIAQRGILWIEVRTSGRAAHGGRPWLGINAIEKMNDFLSRLKDLEKNISSKKHRLVLGPSINIGMIHGGTRVNVVPSSCLADIDRRTIPGETVGEALEEITSVIEEIEAGDRDFKATHSVLAALDSFEIPREHFLVKVLEDSFHEVMGSDATVAGKDATSDAALLYNAGIPTALFGPGQYAASHTADEFVEIEKLLNGTKVLAIAASRIVSA